MPIATDLSIYGIPALSDGQQKISSQDYFQQFAVEPSERKALSHYAGSNMERWRGSFDESRWDNLMKIGH